MALTLVWAAFFWMSVLVLVYTYVAYPLIMYSRASRSPRRVRKRYRRAPISVVLYGDGASRRQRIASILDQDYPNALVDTIVLAEGPEARAEIEAIHKPGIRILELPGPIELPEAINAAVGGAKSDMVVFLGPTHILAPSALAEFVAHFEDPEVGAVVGEVVVPKGNPRGTGEGVAPHSAYEKRILQLESEVDSAAGGDGSVFAVRRQLFAPLPAQILHPDFLILMGVVLKGSRVVYMRSARAFEMPTQAISDFARRTRGFAGILQALVLEPGLLNPKTNRIFFQMVSHKLARLSTPYLLFAALASNVLLHGTFYWFTLVLQSLFHASAFLHFTRLRTSRVGGVIRVSWTFAAHNVATTAGLLVFLQSLPRLVVSKLTNRVIPSQGNEGSAASDPPRSR
jgi:cellulose synthase/poly-beta-1,6-N-acetylglucosamine synthase-like glycosyltransferase